MTPPPPPQYWSRVCIIPLCCDNNNISVEGGTSTRNVLRLSPRHLALPGFDTWLIG